MRALDVSASESGRAMGEDARWRAWTAACEVVRVGLSRGPTGGLAGARNGDRGCRMERWAGGCEEKWNGTGGVRLIGACAGLVQCVRAWHWYLIGFPAGAQQQQEQAKELWRAGRNGEDETIDRAESQTRSSYARRRRRWRVQPRASEEAAQRAKTSEGAANAANSRTRHCRRVSSLPRAASTRRRQRRAARPARPRHPPPRPSPRRSLCASLQSTGAAAFPRARCLAADPRCAPLSSAPRPFDDDAGALQRAPARTAGALRDIRRIGERHGLSADTARFISVSALAPAPSQISNRSSLFSATARLSSFPLPLPLPPPPPFPPARRQSPRFGTPFLCPQRSSSAIASVSEKQLSKA
ncbi:hypothetical protein EVG20_g10205 [Dentipellis fragilis]|uniref:Uncharacterized protein n=1 Tax=Dentipellis fragilis TaxID=205917 RepID=A0A4Y9XTY8_9AGAM|nr:hypothetical protein EVG20_g10205 [Dentipellis fragilis]